MKRAFTLTCGLVTIAALALLPVAQSDGHEQGRTQALAESAEGVCALNAAKTLVEQFDAIDASIVREK